MKPQLSFERFLFVWRRHCRFYRGFCLGMSFLLVDKNSAQLQNRRDVAHYLSRKARLQRIIGEFQNQATRFVNGEAGCICTKWQNVGACRTDKDEFIE